MLIVAAVDNLMSFSFHNSFQELQRTISILQQNLRETVESKELLQEALKSKERSHSPHTDEVSS